MKRCDQNFDQLLDRLNPANDGVNKTSGSPLPGPSGLQQRAQSKNKKQKDKKKQKVRQQAEQRNVKNEPKAGNNNNGKRMSKAEKRACNAIKAMAEERLLSDAISNAKTMATNSNA